MKRIQTALRDPRIFFTLMLMALAIALSACGTTKPVTTEDYVQSAYAQVTAAYKSIGDLKAQGAITSEQATDAIAKVDRVRGEVRTTAALIGQGKVTDPQSALKLTLSGLLLIESQLKKGK